MDPAHHLQRLGNLLEALSIQQTDAVRAAVFCARARAQHAFAAPAMRMTRSRHLRACGGCAPIASDGYVNGSTTPLSRIIPASRPLRSWTSLWCCWRCCARETASRSSARTVPIRRVLPGDSHRAPAPLADTRASHRALTGAHLLRVLSGSAQVAAPSRGRGGSPVARRAVGSMRSVCVRVRVGVGVVGCRAFAPPSGPRAPRPVRRASSRGARAPPGPARRAVSRVAARARHVGAMYGDVVCVFAPK